jgi:uncharacterized protein (TIGR02145 family)
MLSKQILSIHTSLALLSSFGLVACDLVAKNPNSISQSSQAQLSSSLGQSSSDEQIRVSSVSSSSILQSSANSSALISSSSLSSLSSSSFSRFENLIDSRDGQSYPTIKIGNQTWMAKNLNYGGIDISDNKLQQPGQKYCFQNKAEECLLGGALYQWHLAMNLPESCATKACANLIQSKHQGICPTGWHIPSSSDWTELSTFLGGINTAGKSIKLNTTPWTTWNSTSNDGNSSGFSAYPNGLRYYEGQYLYHGSSADGGAIWWASDEWNDDPKNAYRYYANQSAQFYGSNNHEKADAMSVRCLKD